MSRVLLLVAATDRELCGHDGLVCGVGPVEAAAATARALALRPFDALLHVGLAGGRGLAPGTIVVGTEAVYCDLSAEWPVVEPRPGRRRVSSRRSAAHFRRRPRFPCTPRRRSERAGDTTSEGTLVEAMEGFGVLRAAALAGVPAVEVRAISNEIGEPDRSRWQIATALDALERVLPLALAPLRERGEADAAPTARES